MAKTTRPENSPPTGLLLPYLASDASFSLARQVVSALAPSKMPTADNEFKLFGKIINLIILMPENRRPQVAYALQVWPFAALLSTEAYYFQPRLFPDVMSINGYQLRPLKTFEDLIGGLLPSKLFNPGFNRYTVFTIATPGMELPIAQLTICFVGNLAAPLDPSHWCVDHLVKISENENSTELEEVARILISLANVAYRPY